MVVMVCVGLGGTGGGQEEVVLCDNIGLSQRKLPVEDIEELPFYTTDITFAEHSAPRCPIGILR